MNEKDINDIKALFGRPLLLPPEFKSWMVDQFALQVPSIPLSSLVGGRTVERIIDIDASSQTVTGDTDTVVYTLRIPGKTIAKNGRLRVDMAHTLQSASTHNATLNAKINGSTINSVLFGTLASQEQLHCGITIFNMNDYAVQTTEAFARNIVKVVAFTAVDFSVDTTLTLTVDWSSGDANDIFIKKYVFATVFNPEPAT